MARSALSSVINQQQNVSFGNIPIVKRYMKGIFEKNSTFPKFQFTWNVSLLFNICRSMQEIQALDIQKLTQKLVMFMALISGGPRAQTIHSIRVSDIKILDSKLVVPIMSLSKQTKPTKHMAPLCFETYNKEPKLCVVSHLTEYLKRTKSYRHTDKLFLTFIKPYRAASKDSKLHLSFIYSCSFILCKVPWSIVIGNHPECRLEIREDIRPVLWQAD